VTHDQQEALAMSDRICLINRAQVEQIGTPAELYFNPASEFAADFLGDSNILEGIAARRGGNVEVALPGGAIVRARATIPVADGERARWMVRPENVRLVDAADQDFSHRVIVTDYKVRSNRGHAGLLWRR